MIARRLVSVLGAAGLAVAQTNICTQSTATINSPSDATALASCQTIEGSVLISNSSGNTIALDGPERITGDLICTENKAIISLSSTTLSQIGGTFDLEFLTILSTLSFPSLTTVGSIKWLTLNALGGLSFTSKITKASNVSISDTFLGSLEGIDLTSLDGDFDLNNNRYLADFTTQLGNLSGTLNVAANGRNLSVSMPNLIWITDMSISNVTSFSVPSLVNVNGSARFDSNYFTDFLASNLTSSGSDLAFVSNSNLQNISFPALKTVGGGLTVANNTGLQAISGFPDLQSVGGAVLFTGNFTNFTFAQLNDVKGAFTVSSTADIDNSCNSIKGLAPSNQGGNGEIQGTFSCTSNDSNANSNTGNGSDSSGGSGGSSGTKNGGSSLSYSAATVASLAALGGLLALL